MLENLLGSGGSFSGKAEAAPNVRQSEQTGTLGSLCEPCRCPSETQSQI